MDLPEPGTDDDNHEQVFHPFDDELIHDQREGDSSEEVKEYICYLLVVLSSCFYYFITASPAIYTVLHIFLN